MSWRDTLEPWSFRDIAFSADSHSPSGGRRSALHEFPGKNLGWVEDLGRKQKPFSVEGYVLATGFNGFDYTVQRDALQKALDADGPGILVHRYLGRKKVIVQNFTGPTESAAEGGFARFSITFILEGEKTFPSEIDDFPTLSQAASAACAIASNDVFAEGFSIADTAQFVAENAQEQLDNAVSQLRAVNGIIDTTQAAAADFADDVNALGDELGSLLSTPSQLASSFSSIYGSFSDAARTIRSSIESTGRLLDYYLGMASFNEFNDDTTPPDPVTANRVQEANNQAQITQFIQSQALSAAVSIASHRTYRTDEDAARVFNQIATQTKKLEREAPDELYIALNNMKSALQKDFESRDLARVTIEKSSGPLPGLVHTQNQYGSIERYDELVSVNDFPNSFYVPGNSDIKVIRP